MIQNEQIPKRKDSVLFAESYIISLFFIPYLRNGLCDFLSPPTLWGGLCYIPLVCGFS